MLTTKGAKSGLLHKTAVMRVEHDGVYAVVGSQGAAPTDPAWVFNVRAHPLVELQDGAEKHDYRAREADGEERAGRQVTEVEAAHERACAAALLRGWTEKELRQVGVPAPGAAPKRPRAKRAASTLNEPSSAVQNEYER